MLKNTNFFDQGYSAFYSNNDNPYIKQKNSWANKEWQRGWNFAYFENKRKVESNVAHAT